MIRLVATLVSAGVRTAVDSMERAIAVTRLRRELGKANARVADLERQVAQLNAQLEAAKEFNTELLKGSLRHQGQSS